MTTKDKPIIVNWKKFKVLTAEPNWVDILEKDWVYYFTGKAAERVCKEQWLKLLENRKEVEEFVNTFKWATEKEKIMDFVEKFWLKKAGYWHPYDKTWDNVGSVGYAYLSRVDENDNVYEVRWTDDTAYVSRGSQEFPSPFIWFEDCSAEGDS